MSRGIALRVDAIAVAGIDPRAAAPLRRTVEAALERLAERLERSPVARGEAGVRLALDALEVRGVAPDELLGPAGAERLADALWAELARRIG